MVGVLLISHGLLCQGLADSVSMVAGNIEQSECISLKPGQDPGEFKEKVRQGSGRAGHRHGSPCADGSFRRDTV